ncbi:MAG: Wzz/FepE/Etk N-terminal domain-containing protein [Acidimicrobiia bacterium]
MEHFRLMWRRRWIIVAVSLIIAAGAYAWSRARPKVYQATAQIDVISDATADTTSLGRENVEIVSGRFAALADTSSILRDAIDLSGLNISLSTARGRVTADDSDTLGFVEVVARGPSPASAEALADGVVESLQQDAEDAAVETDEEQAPIPRVVSPADASPTPIEPKPERDAVLAFLVALVLSAETAALLGTVAGRFPAGRIREEVEEVTDVPVLARIPRKGHDEVVEAFRELRAQVDFARGGVDVRSVAVTGVDPGGGASYVARGLAQIAANLKVSVVLVDANLRRPSVAENLHLPPSPGLGDLLLGSAFEPSILRQANPLQKRFRVLTAGLAVPDAPGLLGGGALRKLLDQLTDVEIVVVDTPAVTESADALVIAAQVDASILVVDASATRKRALHDGVRRLTPHARLLGTVLNRDELRSARRWRR